jgi:hypothetical protein
LSGASQWHFPGKSADQITNLFRSCRFSEGDLRRLMEGAECEYVIPAGAMPEWRNTGVPLAELRPVAVSLFPPTDMVLNLPSDVRSRIYHVLAGSDRNPRQRNPFRVPASQFEAWLAQSGLPSGTRAWVRRLTYRQDQMICLADWEPLRQQLTLAEMRPVLKAVYRNPTFVVRLQVTPATDVEAVSRYWGRGGRARSIRPLLGGLAKTPGRNSVNIAFLMPAFARTHLYTFPDPAKEPAHTRHCGLWTALNFFNEQPDNRYLDPEYAQRAFRTQFETGGRVPKYGDLLALYSPAGDLVHVGVYLAAEFVFTRSGMGEIQPWVLMKRSDLIRRFQTVGEVRTVIHRRKKA